MKIGIISLYFKSNNYGGNLQAYALTAYLNKYGYQAEQICYTGKVPYMHLLTCRNLGIEKKMKNILWKMIGHARSAKYLWLMGNPAHWKIHKRESRIGQFNFKEINHSKKVYSAYTFAETASHYDTFVTGSDQVWSNQWGICPAYFLASIPSAKTKLSYAASLGKGNWTDEKLEVHRKYLADFDAISVREEDAVHILSDVAPVHVEWVVDPTLLLTRADWDEICAERMVNQPYLFCYFLGADIEERELAKAYAKQQGLKLVTMPFLLREMLLQKDFRKYESSFGDEQLYDVPPEQFLSLIKHASCVFTDSFHAALFSGVFQREYFIFGRSEMNSRITSLTKLYETEERFCNTSERRTIEYILAQKPIDYARELNFLASMRLKSMDFLKNNLEKAERKINGI